jgi:two-component system response regulator DesR
MSRKLKPHVVVVGAELPERDGFSVASELHGMLPACRVLILTARRNPCEVRRAAAVHAAGIIVLDAATDFLAEAIRRVSKGTKVIDPDLAFAALSMGENPLTPREIDALKCASEGATTAEIAKCLGLSVGTVRNYVSRAIAKTGARNRVDAIRIAEGSGWLYASGQV